MLIKQSGKNQQTVNDGSNNSSAFSISKKQLDGNSER
jgi:hypothetical protein